MKHVILLVLLLVSLEAKIIEAKQLFNKTYATVAEESISLSKTFYANIEIDESKIVDINTRFDGFIDTLYADKTYMYVTKDTPLLSLYSDDVTSAQDELILAKKMLNNKSMYNSAYNKLLSLGLHVKTMEKIKSSSKVIENIEIYSPIDGFILNKKVNKHSFIKKGSLIFQIVDLKKLWAIVEVYQQDLDFISLGMNVDVKIEGINGTIKSTIDSIYPLMQKDKKTAWVRVLIDNKDLKILPNMFAKAIIKKQEKTFLTLPKSAVLTKGDKHYVFMPKNQSEFEPLLIQAKRIDSEKYEILSGLDKGERVIDKVLFMLDSDAITNGLYDLDSDW